MNQEILWAVDHTLRIDDKNLPIMGLEGIKKAKASYKSFPQYTKTPFTRLDYMVRYLGVKDVSLRDESCRLGLNTFRVLSGFFVMARYITNETNRDVSELPYPVLTSDQLRKEFGQAAFFTATDGNHGCGVTWAANCLGQKTAVYMPRDSTQTRLENIAKEGAQVGIQEMSYDNCVRLAAKGIDETERGVTVRDIAWDDYKEIPAWVMQGCGTMAMEAGEQLKEYGYRRPAHIFVQASVDSLVGTVAGYSSNLYADNPPAFVIMEAEVAACLYKGTTAGDGAIRTVDGDMGTIMAGLACDGPNTISWDILKNHVKMSVAAPDWIAVAGMHISGAPIKGDASVTSGESGTAPSGALAAMTTIGKYKDLRSDIEPDESSKVLLFSAEGDMDPNRYKNIVWGSLDR